MEEILLKMKRLLNSINDEELKNMDLWINGENKIQILVMDENSILLITDREKLKYDDIEL